MAIVITWRARVKAREDALERKLRRRVLYCGVVDANGRQFCQGIVAYLPPSLVDGRPIVAGLVYMRSGDVQHDDGYVAASARAVKRAATSGHSPGLRRPVRDLVDPTQAVVGPAAKRLPLYARCTHSGKHLNVVDSALLQSIADVDQSQTRD